MKTLKYKMYQTVLAATFTRNLYCCVPNRLAMDKNDRMPSWSY